VKFAAIADWADQKLFTVAYMCEQLGVSRSGYYAWRDRPTSDREEADARLSAIIADAHQRLRGNPGVRRMHAELASLGELVSPKRVWRLMRTLGLQGRVTRRRGSAPRCPASTR